MSDLSLDEEMFSAEELAMMEAADAVALPTSPDEEIADLKRQVTDIAGLLSEAVDREHDLRQRVSKLEALLESHRNILLEFSLMNAQQSP